jgi:hypothetical protein
MDSIKNRAKNVDQQPFNMSRYADEIRFVNRILRSNHNNNNTIIATLATDTASAGNPPPIACHTIISTVPRQCTPMQDTTISNATCHGFGLSLKLIILETNGYK